jgi:hypothetical protein
MLDGVRKKSFLWPHSETYRYLFSHPPTWYKTGWKIENNNISPEFPLTYTQIVDRGEDALMEGDQGGRTLYKQDKSI